MAKDGGYLIASLAAGAAAAHEPVVVLPEDGRHVPVPLHETTPPLSEADSPAGVSVYELVDEPMSGGAPPHQHTHEDEYACVLDGTLALMLGDQTLDARPGTFAALNRGTVHAFWNATDRPVRTLFFVSRGGLEQFFDAVAVALRDRPLTGASDVRSPAARADMTTWWFRMAGGLCVLGVAAHEVLGAPMVLPPLSETALPDEVVWLHHFSWHVGSIAVIAMAYLYFHASQRPENVHSAVVATTMSLGFALLGPGLAILGNGALWGTPAPYLWAVVCIAGALGIWRTRTG